MDANFFFPLPLLQTNEPNPTKDRNELTHYDLSVLVWSWLPPSEHHVNQNSSVSAEGQSLACVADWNWATWTQARQGKHAKHMSALCASLNTYLTLLFLNIRSHTHKKEKQLLWIFCVLAPFAREQWEQARTEALNWSFHKEITCAFCRNPTANLVSGKLLEMFLN